MNLIENTLVDVFFRRVRETPEHPAIMHKVDGQYSKVIWREHGRVTELIAAGLLNLSVNAGDKVAIMSQSKAYWTWADLAILANAAVTVPIYPTLAGPEVEYIAKHSDVIGIFVENENQLQKLLSIKNLGPNLRFIVLFEGTPVVDPRLRILAWDDLLKDGEVFILANPECLEERIASIKPENLASIVYTSGTTGIPKGAMLSHANLYSVCEALSKLFGFQADDVSLSFLPLSHVYERVGGQFLSIFDGIPMAYAQAIETVPQNLIEVKPTILNGVPRFYEKAYHRIQTEIRRLSKPQQYLIKWSLALGKRAARCKQLTNDDLICHFYRSELRVADRLVFSKIRRRFGGKLRLMVSGAAPLSEDVYSFFDIIGINMLEGYGLTETTAPVTCNTLADNRPGTVGRPLPGVQVKIADDGEILLKGPNVFVGYYKDPQATEAAFKDGWFLTGDIGEIDKDGYLTIKDRKKDIIITSGGKHVAPQYIENLFQSERLINQIVVYGDRKNFISALITLNHDSLQNFAKTEEISYTSLTELVHHPRVKEELNAIIELKNSELASFEQIKKFIVLDEEFTLEANELTPTFKIRRKIIIDKYKNKLDALYETRNEVPNAGFIRQTLEQNVLPDTN